MKNNLYLLFKCLFFAMLVLPLVVLPPFLSTPDWDKAIIFRILMALIIGIFLWNVFKNRQEQTIKTKIKPVKALFALLSVFFLFLLLSAIFSQDISFSLWGSPYRAGGFVTYSFYIFFAVLAFLIIKPDDWKKLLDWSLAVGCAVSLIAIFQSFNFFNKILVSFNGGAPSTTGNSILLALYCLMLFFIALVFFIKAGKRWQKILYAATCALLLLTILIANERAAYLGIIAGSLYFIFFYPQKNKWLRLAKVGGIALLILIIGIVAYVNITPKLPDFVEQNNFLHNISAKLSLKLVIDESRFSGWQIMLNAVKEKPLLGWGPENLQIGYDKHYNPNLPQIVGLWWDRAHNFMLEIAVSSGVPALAAFIFFFTLLFWQLQKVKNRQPLLSHMVQTALLAYFVANFFSIDGLPTYIILFLLVGYSFHLISREKGEIIAATPVVAPRKNRFVFSSITILVLIFVLFFAVLPFKTNLAISRAADFAANGQCDQAILLMDKHLSDKNFVVPYLRLKYADILRTCEAIDPHKSMDYVKRAFVNLQQNITDQPKFTRLWVSLAAFGNVLIAQESDPQKKLELVNLVYDYEKQGLLMASKRQDLYLEKSKTYYVTKNYPEMERTAKNCLQISDEFEGCWWYLGIAEIFQGRQRDGKEHIAKALALGSEPLYFQLTDAYVSQKNYADAALAYYPITINHPENASYHATLAVLYKEIGKYSLAADEALAVFQLQPENTDAQEFLKEMALLAPRDGSVHFALALMYKELKNFDLAKQEALYALGVEPKLRARVDEFLSSLLQ